MSASGKTPNFDFPLYEVQDNFAPLTSFNLLSNKVDQQLALVKSSADSAEALSSANEQDIQALETWKAGLMTQLNDFFNPHFLTINTSIPGSTANVAAACVLMGSLIYIYSHNTFHIQDMMKIPITTGNIYPIFSTPNLIIPNMKENTPYNIGPVYCLLNPIEGQTKYTDWYSRERPIVFYRQNSITYGCVKLIEEDETKTNYVIPVINITIPVAAIWQSPT